MKKTEVNSNIQYASAQERKQLVDDERRHIDDKVRKVIALKKLACDNTDKTFCVINQKGIDPLSLDMLAKEGIIALRRAKRRNMERLMLATGGIQINALDDSVSIKDLGFATDVYEHILGEEKYTFVEGVENPFSCTILIKGPNKHSIAQTKDAIRDGLRSVKNTIEDATVLPGAGAWQIAAHQDLVKYKNEVSGRTKLGVQVFADALLIIPKTLAANSGFDAIDSMVKMQERYSKGKVVGLDLETGDVLSPEEEGIYDNSSVIRQVLNSSTVIASQLLLVDEVLRAGKNISGAKAPQMQ